MHLRAGGKEPRAEVPSRKDAGPIQALPSSAKLPPRTCKGRDKNSSPDLLKPARGLQGCLNFPDGASHGLDIDMSGLTSSEL